MNAVTIATIITAAVTCLAIVVCLALDLHIGRVKLYWAVGVVGAVAALSVNHASFCAVAKTLVQNTAVNPLKILTFFLCMAAMSGILDDLDVFEYVAIKCAAFAKNSQYKLFLTFYALVSVLTVFTSNDIVILAFIPFICGFCKHGGIDPLPYVISTFVAANTWSMLLIFGNPTNVYVSAFAQITFGGYFVKMALPTLASAAVSLGIMLLLFRTRLRAGCGSTERSPLPHVYKPLVITNVALLASCTVLLAVASYINVEMWTVALAFAAVTVIVDIIICAATGKKKGLVLRSIVRAPWEFVPFLISMFLIVTCLDVNGVTKDLAQLFGTKNIEFIYGAASFLCANLVNNIPMTTLFAYILEKGAVLSGGAFAVVIGSNLGALLTPIGALAGIMLLRILKQKEVRFSIKAFTLYGATVSIPTLATALGVLCLL